MIYGVVADYQKQHPEFCVVRHEELSLDPLGKFRDLYSSLGLNFSQDTQRAILKASSSDNPGELSKNAIHATRLDSAVNLNNWKKRLTHEEIDRIHKLTQEIAPVYYSETSWV
jgi:hypothetical protein